jgi:hypothetical protein
MCNDYSALEDEKWQEGIVSVNSMSPGNRITLKKPDSALTILTTMLANVNPTARVNGTIL